MGHRPPANLLLLLPCTPCSSLPVCRTHRTAQNRTNSEGHQHNIGFKTKLNCQLPTACRPAKRWLPGRYIGSCSLWTTHTTLIQLPALCRSATHSRQCSTAHIVGGSTTLKGTTSSHLSFLLLFVLKNNRHSPAHKLPNGLRPNMMTCCASQGSQGRSDGRRPFKPRRLIADATAA